MALTYGFFDSINGDRLYSSSQLSTLFNGIISDGVFANIGSMLNVTAPDNGRYVIVGTGRAWFNGIWVNNDSAFPIPRNVNDQITDIVPDFQFTRIDAVVIKIDRSMAVRAATIELFAGEPAPNPVKPVPIDTDYVSYHVLAYITIPPNATQITNSMIEIAVGTDATPLVTGILKTASLEELWIQWEGEFDDWMDSNSSTFSLWWNDMKRVINGESMETYLSASSFPNPGDITKLYLATDESKVYRWDGSSYVFVDDFTDAAEVMGNLAVRIVDLERASDLQKGAIDIVLTPGTAGWGASEPYHQRIPFSDINEGDRPIIMPNVPEYDSGIDIDDYLDECALVTKFEVEDGAIVAWCYQDIPTLELSFAVKGR